MWQNEQSAFYNIQLVFECAQCSLLRTFSTHATFKKTNGQFKISRKIICQYEYIVQVEHKYNNKYGIHLLERILQLHKHLSRYCTSIIFFWKPHKFRVRTTELKVSLQRQSIMRHRFLDLPSVFFFSNTAYGGFFPACLPLLSSRWFF